MNPKEFCRERGFTTAILLTYEFDALFFERVALREFWAGDTGDILVLADGTQLAQSVQRWQGQLQHLGRRYQLNSANTAARFHPKAMLRLGRDGGAVWLGSGNQTFGGWGGNQELCCAWAFGPGKRDSGSWVPRLLERIQAWSPSGLEYDIVKRVHEMPWLQSMLSEGQTGSETILTSYENLPLASQLQRRWVGRRFTRVRIFTGSTDENGALLERLHDDFGVEDSLVVLDESRASFLPAKLRALPLATRVMKLPKTSPMHAKFYWFDGPDGPAAVMGSANCSAAAWLLPPESGGNIEAVAIYDNPQAEQFKAVLNLFESEELTDARFDDKPHTRDKETGVTGPSLSELSWDSTLGEIRVRFNSSAHEIKRAFVDLDDSSVELKLLSGSELWFAESPEIADHLETVFVKVRLELGSGISISYWRWLNDLVELRHASRGRHIADALNALKRSSSEDQQKIVASLQRISIALLSEPESFPDPLIRTARSEFETESDTEKEVKRIDPDEFVRSINDPDSPARSHEVGSQSVPLSLIGVMRALFPPEGVAELGDEADFADEPDEQEVEKKKKLPAKTDIERPPLPASRYKQRLSADVDLFIQRLGQPGFAAVCTVTQLVQACAYPIAVAALGSEGDWIDHEDAIAWASRIFDVLFISRQDDAGLLEKVHARYKVEGQQMAFLKIVGDGTLWVTLLSALSSLTPGIPKALALRSLLQTEALISNTNRGRIETLLGRLARSRADAFLKQAVGASDLLSALEQRLANDYEHLRRNQEETQLACSVGDILWKPIAGWAESQGTSPWGANVKVHLHLRAGTRLISSKLFINVSKSAGYNVEMNRIRDLITPETSPG